MNKSYNIPKSKIIDKKYINKRKKYIKTTINIINLPLLSLFLQYIYIFYNLKNLLF